MNITARFSMIMKTSISSLLESFEDPERSLHQLILDMEEDVDRAKRAAARALANEDRLRNKLRFQEKDSKEWQKAAECSMDNGNDEEAREALRRSELADRQTEKLRAQLEEQETETREVRESIALMNERVGQAKSRLQILQARLRHSEARKQVADVMKGVSRRDHLAEFDRLSDRLEDQTAEDRAYWKLDDEIRGDDLRRRVTESQVDAAVEDRLDKLKAKRAPKAPDKTARRKKTGTA